MANKKQPLGDVSQGLIESAPSSPVRLNIPPEKLHFSRNLLDFVINSGGVEQWGYA
jgi:hypothetical protein